ncbi:MAG: aminodeoxychorismate/anthranilate synthase component II [Gammaproteobacteria bacterium]|nr:aminodeoxychorismate/anthranilate synthase component II [Gammaproteobacteria bacterium]
MILLIDNYDSFTYNVAQYLGELGADVQVHRNDEIGLGDIERMAPDRIVISPGPCTPNEAGISLSVVEAFGKEIPTLGICLGHQSIGQAYGGTVRRARQVMHGKLSAIHHSGRGVFRELPPAFEATRYHSLIVTDIPECLEVTAWTATELGEADEVMGIKHREHPVEGVQFHPESIKTQVGHRLLGNFLTR